jgi:uncharacterized protein (TIGR00369 family)
MQTETASVGLSIEELRGVLRRTPFTSLFNPEVIRCDSGHSELSIQMRPELTQHHGFAHGAVVGCLADSACAWAAASVAGDVVTSSYNINLIAPGVGEKLVARGEVVQAVSNQVICRSEVFAVRGDRQKLIAVALATIVVVTPRRNRA